MPVLSISDLSIGFSEQELLVEDVNLSIEAEEIHGLIGESGSGKSLTALAILNLLPKGIKITKGIVELKLQDEGIKYLNTISQKDLRNIRGRRVGFIFQDPMTSLNPSQRCGNQVVEVLKEHNIVSELSGEETALELFRKVRISDPKKIYNAYPHEVSGGQRQRVMIAMALACKPSLLIADEPTTALDVTVQKSIVELIDELRKSEKLAVLFISHDLGFISHYADKISIMYRGRIVEMGTKKDIILNSKHPYTRGLLECRPPLDHKIHRLRTLEDAMDKKTFSVKDEKEQTIKIKSQQILSVKDLNVYYPLESTFYGKITKEMHALKNINFEVFKGESLGLVGESGSGKSSLGRALLRLVEARSGNVRYNGTMLSDLNSKSFKNYRKKIQFIFQDPFASLNPKMCIGDSIMEPMNVHNIGIDQSERKYLCISLLKKVGLSESDYNKYPHQFSGGQRQRIVIARALSLKPEFIICDEAVSALDVSVQARILNLLKDLQDEFNLTYLFITHDMSVVRFFCDRIIVMKEGVIVEYGEVDKIFNSAENEFTRELIDASF